jgi:hypothetical protein
LTNVDAVMKVPVDGGTPIAVALGQRDTDAIAVDSTGAYWTDLGIDRGGPRRARRPL